MERDILKILETHEKRIADLESRFADPKIPLATKDKKTLSDHVVELRDGSFFAAPKVAEEVHEKLQESYHCERNRVDVALLRLADRKQLRRTSIVVDSKKYKAYVW